MAEQKQSGGDKTEAMCSVELAAHSGHSGGAAGPATSSSDNSGRSMDVFSDPYLGAIMLVLLLLHLLQQSMRDPCTC